jgi:hypothetical protein
MTVLSPPAGDIEHLGPQIQKAKDWQREHPGEWHEELLFPWTTALFLPPETPVEERHRAVEVRSCWHASSNDDPCN